MNWSRRPCSSGGRLPRILRLCSPSTLESVTSAVAKGPPFGVYRAASVVQLRPGTAKPATTGDSRSNGR